LNAQLIEYASKILRRLFSFHQTWRKTNRSRTLEDLRLRGWALILMKK
jgi:hypothetical protein